MIGIHHVQRTVKAGIKHHYYTYRGGKKFWESMTPISDPAPKSFVLAYQKTIKAHPKPEPKDKNSVSWLIDDYKGTFEFKRLSKSTKTSYEANFKAIAQKFGRERYSHFADKRARGVVKKWHNSYSVTPRLADMHLTRLVLILNHAVDNGYILDHCAHRIAHLYNSDRSQIIWTPEEASALYAACKSKHVEMALRFLMATGFRREAATRIPRTAVKDGWIEWKYGRGKKQIDVALPITPEIRECLDWFDAERKAKPHIQVNTICFSSRHRPWTPDGLSTLFQRARKICGVDKRIHDMRGTAATMYYAADFTPQQIAGFIGWNVETVEGIIGRYVHRPTIMRENVIRLAKGSK